MLCQTNPTIQILFHTDIIDELLYNLYFYCEETLLFTTPKLLKTSAEKLSVLATIQERNKEGDYRYKSCNIKLFEFFPDSMTLCDYVNSKRTRRYKELYGNLGFMCSKLFEFLRNQSHLKDHLKYIRDQCNFQWQLTTSERRIRELAKLYYPDEDDGRRRILDNALDEFSSIKDELKTYTEYILHGDLSSNNILVSLEACTGNDRFSPRICLIDFQDAQVGQQVVELVILILHCILQQNIFEFNYATLVLIPYWILHKYQTSTRYKLSDKEITFIPTLMKLRICQSLMYGQEAILADPDNSYVLESSKRGWHLLSELSKPSKLAESWLDLIKDESAANKLYSLNYNNFK